MFSKKNKNLHSYKNSHMSIIAALLIITNNWKQLIVLQLVNEYTNWYTHSGILLND